MNSAQLENVKMFCWSSVRPLFIKKTQLLVVVAVVVVRKCQQKNSKKQPPQLGVLHQLPGGSGQDGFQDLLLGPFHNETGIRGSGHF